MIANHLTAAQTEVALPQKNQLGISNSTPPVQKRFLVPIRCVVYPEHEVTPHFTLPTCSFFVDYVLKTLASVGIVLFGMEPGSVRNRFAEKNRICRQLVSTGTSFAPASAYTFEGVASTGSKVLSP